MPARKSTSPKPDGSAAVVWDTACSIHTSVAEAKETDNTLRKILMQFGV